MSAAQTPVDWHVHVHRPEDAAAVLDAAAGQFARVSPRGDGPLGVLMLAEMPGQSVFDALGAQRSLPGGWSIRPAEEAVSLIICRGQDRLAIVAGFQVVTAERLEVLALGTRTRPGDGLPAEQVLAELAEQGTMAILPWGVGKWFGARGRLVQALTARLPPAALSLGDNGGRPAFWPVPTAFRMAECRGIAVLPGTDTLSCAQPTAGGFGSMVPEALSLGRPAEALRRLLADPYRALTPYGPLASTASFVRGQLGLRLQRFAPTRGT